MRICRHFPRTCPEALRDAPQFKSIARDELYVGIPEMQISHNLPLKTSVVADEIEIRVHLGSYIQPVLNAHKGVACLLVDFEIEYAPVGI